MDASTTVCDWVCCTGISMYIWHANWSPVQLYTVFTTSIRVFSSGKRSLVDSKMIAHGFSNCLRRGPDCKRRRTRQCWRHYYLYLETGTVFCRSGLGECRGSSIDNFCHFSCLAVFAARLVSWEKINSSYKHQVCKISRLTVNYRLMRRPTDAFTSEVSHWELLHAAYSHALWRISYLKQSIPRRNLLVIVCCAAGLSQYKWSPIYHRITLG